MAKKVTRLYKQFSPEHYDISLAISEDKKSFTGSVTIIGNRNARPSQRITLHQRALTITVAKVYKIDKKGIETELPLSRVVSQKALEEVRLHAEQGIHSGRYRIELTFSGKITTNMEGIYTSNFTEDGAEKQLVATQLESHAAREVFPCIDEPEAKATFTLTLEHSPDEMALSNTPVAAEKIVEGRKQTSFKKTPIMSTYLLAFVVGELAYKEAKSKRNITIRTYATKNQIEHTSFALDVAVKCMDFYEEYYAIPFPLEKCDFIALPDFASGAMENWGLITFREQALLFDAANTSLSMQQYIAIVVAHELTHQWFGNLVTMRWWTDLWLNEGFASWMEYLAIDHFYPQWDLWTQFAVDEQQHALKLDALEHTHAVEVPIKHPDEIRTIFDAISYQKGASVIHMLHSYLGADVFRDGLRHYLKTHAYKNTETIDLWDALEHISKKPVKQFMSAWTKQAGYPIVTVNKVNNYLELSQQRFIANPVSEHKDTATIWPVPLLAEVAKDTLTKKSQRVEVTAETPLLNKGRTGFYRVHYNQSMQPAIRKLLKSGKLSAVDRMGLLSDSFEVTRAGYQPTTDFLDLLSDFASEDSLPVWEILSGAVGAIRATMGSSDDVLRSALKPLLLSLTNEQFTRLGWDKKPEEKHLDSLLRPIIAGIRAGADDPALLKQIDTLFSEVTTSTNPIDPDMRTLVYSSIARRRGAAVFDSLLNLYRSTTASDEKLALTSGMTSFEDPKVHEKVLALLTDGTVRLQDVSYWLVYSLVNRHTKAQTWQWIQDNWQWLDKNLGGDLSFSRMPVYVARGIIDDKMLAEYQQFFTKVMSPVLERSYEQGVELAQTAIEWRKRDADSVLNWAKSWTAR